MQHLQQQLQHLKAERDRLQLHLQIAQQQQRLQSSLSAGGSSNFAMQPAAALEHEVGPGSQSAATLSGTAASAALQAALGSFASTTSAAAGPHSSAAAVGGGSRHTSDQGAEPVLPTSMAPAAAPQPAKGDDLHVKLLPVHDSVRSSMQVQQVASPLTPTAAAGSATAAGMGLLSFNGIRRNTSMSTSGGGDISAAGAGGVGVAGGGTAAAQPAVSMGDQEALCVVQQLKTALPQASPVQTQLASLMAAIQAGVQERQALTAQGQVLLDMLVGGQ